ncbi:MAG: glycosyltransferase family 9 protein [Bacteroidetes bacterium]|nr:MAG: glycosyltransferase family 9 protein [Bacteroidota bacterium]
MPKFLVIRFSSIGDIVLTTPVIRCLALQVPEAEVHVVTKAGFASILEHNPYVHTVHLLHQNWHQLVATLRLQQFDAIIDLHHNLRTARLKWALGVRSTAFKKLNLQKFILTNFKVNLLPPVHIVQRYLKTVAHLGVIDDGRGLDYFIQPTDKVGPEQLPAAHANGYIALVIGAALATKQLPTQQLASLCRHLLPHPVILLGGPTDAATGAELAAINPEKIFNACGRFGLNQSASLVQGAQVVITHDTGLMHIAAAYKKPIISIWGNTIPGFGMGPFYGNHQVPHQAFEVSGLSCRPCSKIGHKKCPKKHFNCMQLQNMHSVATAALAQFKTHL